MQTYNDDAVVKELTKAVNEALGWSDNNDCSKESACLDRSYVKVVTYTEDRLKSYTEKRIKKERKRERRMKRRFVLSLFKKKKTPNKEVVPDDVEFASPVPSNDSKFSEYYRQMQESKLREMMAIKAEPRPSSEILYYKAKPIPVDPKTMGLNQSNDYDRKGPELVELYLQRVKKEKGKRIIDVANLIGKSVDQLKFYRMVPKQFQMPFRTICAFSIACDLEVEEFYELLRAWGHNADMQNNAVIVTSYILKEARIQDSVFHQASIEVRLKTANNTLSQNGDPALSVLYSLSDY